ncbi:dipicolinate synthase subunit DpsA [Virgibacillus oceani]
MILKKKNILILGGDARTLEVITKLAEKGMHVFAAGFEKISFDFPNIHYTAMDDIEPAQLDAILLPVRGTDTSGNVEADYSDKQIVLSKEFLKKTKADCIIYSGTANQYLTSMAKSADRQLINIFDRDDIAIFNSIPTAEGALMLAIQETDVTIHGASVVVLGFGRVGMTTAHLFSSVGAKVTVATRRSEPLARARQMGMSDVDLKNLKDTVTTAQICINTIPQLTLNKEILSVMDPSCLILDLASGDGGTDFQAAKSLGIKALHSLGLPGKTASKTAGTIIGDILLELLEKNSK